MNTLTFLLFLATLFCAVQCWGYEGHKVVAIIADSMLTPDAVEAAKRLINTSIPTIASLPDQYDHTRTGKWSGVLHYANLPKDATSFDLNRDCPAAGCVVSAIYNYTTLTAKRVKGMPWNHPGEPTPLEFLVHFVGDVHQPLHVAYGFDEGGNSHKVSFFGEKAELHGVWDNKIIQRYNNDPASFASELQQYINDNPDWAKKVVANTDVISWADESFDVVRNDCYNFIDNNMDPDYIGDKYYQKNLATIKLRLAAAGLRLGTLINAIVAQQSSYLSMSKFKITLN
eukprot:TRINITY_DN2004_c0_g1_i1.p1 TRINITY_DN2004_c0_g1~~TRINITY_DN2004_c0_g1_i1.p1  ORF type:complete len:285 (-),score=71.24 TRINITY_DN2004_c0_g1_i1:96-950(-)